MNIKASLLILAVGCNGGKDTDTATSPCGAGSIRLSDANNYAFSGSLNVPSITTAAGTDVQVCWDDVVQDFRCHDVDPAADIDNVGMVRFTHLTQDEVKAGLSANDLHQSDMSGYVESRNDGQTCTNLASMSFFGTPIDVAAEYTATGGTYMLLLTTGTTPGVGARMITFLQPDVNSTVTEAHIANGCGVLDFSVDLHSLDPLPVCTTSPWTVDWSGVTVDGQGHALDPSKIDSVMVGYFAGSTVPAIEGDFLNLEENATPLYTLDVPGGSSADLTQAKAGDVAFPGFTGDGVWVLALRCSSCFNPAPPFLTVIAPTDPAVIR